MQILYDAGRFARAVPQDLDLLYGSHFGGASKPQPPEPEALLRVQSSLEGESEVVLELEVTRDLSLVGRVESGGNSAIGLYFTHDY